MSGGKSAHAIRHPGPVAPDRAVVVPCRAHPVTVRLRAGLSFGDAVARGLAEAGHAAGYLRLSDIPMARLDYVIPAPAPGDGHAAWYSATRRIAAAPRIVTAGVHLGLRDGAPFTHCHGIWAGQGVASVMGHLLPFDSVIGEECEAAGWGISGAALVVGDDPETQFSLFRPQAMGDAGRGGQAAYLCTLRPNQDISEALATLAAAQGLGDAQIEGIGSLVGTRFTDAPELDSYATEVLLHAAAVRAGQARLEAFSVGFDGRHAGGILAPGENAVCVTAEILMLGA